MELHTLDKANLINELQCGQSVGQAIHQSRRSDFALLLAMLSQDVRDTTPIDKLPDPDHTDLYHQFSVPKSQPLVSDQQSYQRGEKIAEQFNHSGIMAAKLQCYLSPEALTYRPEQTHNLPEEVYHNLSGHQRRELAEGSHQGINLDLHLYHSLVINQRQSQIQAQL